MARSRFSVFLFASLAGAALCATPLLDLPRLRYDHEQEVNHVILPLEEGLVQQLAQLQREFASKEDYKSAIKTKAEITLAQQRIQELKRKLAEPPPPPALAMPEKNSTVGSPSLPSNSTSVILLPKEAVVHGLLQLSPTAETIASWKTVDDSLEWKLNNLPPGGYEVIMEYSCLPNEGGRFQLSEAFHSLTGIITSTGGQLVKKNIGTLRIKTGDGKLTMKALSIIDGRSLLQLKSIELARADI